MILRVFKQRKLIVRRSIRRLELWLLLAFFSCLIGGITLNSKAPDFSSAAISNIPKTLLFLLFATVWGSQDDEYVMKLNTLLIQGILLGFYLNLLWAIVDASVFYISGKSINNSVFSGYIARHSVRYGKISLVYSGLIRASGFNIDPANIGFIAPVVTGIGLFKRNYWLVLFAFGGLLASASMTGFVCCFFVIIVYLSRVKSLKRNSGIKVNYLILLILILIILVAFGIKYGTFIIDIISQATNSVFKRLSESYLNDSGLSDTIRWAYFIYAPLAFFNLNILGIFGLGFGTASYGYVTDSYILSKIGSSYAFPFDMENTYLAYLMDTGIVGLCIFISIIVLLFKWYKKRINYSQEVGDYNLTLFCCTLGMVFSMLFYHYILFAPQLLILIAGLSHIDLVKK